MLWPIPFSGIDPVLHTALLRSADGNAHSEQPAITGVAHPLYRRVHQLVGDMLRPLLSRTSFRPGSGGGSAERAQVAEPDPLAPVVKTNIVSADAIPRYAPLTGDWTPERLQEVVRVGNAELSPDGREVLFTTRQTILGNDETPTAATTHVYLARADGSGQERLLTGEYRALHWDPTPGSRRFAVIVNGNLALVSLDTRNLDMLTAGKARISDFKWMPDGQGIVFARRNPDNRATNPIDPAAQARELCLVSLAADATGARPVRVLVEDLHIGGYSLWTGNHSFDISPDGSRVAFCRCPAELPPVGIEDGRMTIGGLGFSQLSVVDVSTGEVTALGPQDHRSQRHPVFSPDGASIAYLQSESPIVPGNSDVMVIDVHGEMAPRRLAATPNGMHPHNGRVVGWTCDSREVVAVDLDGTRFSLYALPVDGGAPRVLDRRAGDYGAFHELSLSGDQVTYCAPTADYVPEVHVGTMLPQRLSVQQVSDVNAAYVGLRRGEIQAIRWHSSDGTRIEGLLTYPVGYEPSRRYPLLMILNGGPNVAFVEGSVVNRYTSNTWPEVPLGCADYLVLRANLRGSNGYGAAHRSEFMLADLEASVEDALAGIHYVVHDLGVADADRVGALGWSYGGHVTLRLAAEAHRRGIALRAIAVGAAVTSFPDLLERPNETLREELFGNGGPEFDLSAHLADIHVPTLIQWGTTDFYPVGERLYDHLAARGVPVRMVSYPNEVHIPARPENLIRVMDEDLAWFERYVKNG